MFVVVRVRRLCDLSALDGDWTTSDAPFSEAAAGLLKIKWTGLFTVFLEGSLGTG
tara:strand:- start:429 stop:593 length:165 start_codon:yes stop_codon:yes gene_type:complete